MGQCPCPRCTLPKTEIRGLGTEEDGQKRDELQRKYNRALADKIDSARQLIYKDGYVVNSDRVEAVLKSESWVPSKVSQVFAGFFSDRQNFRMCSRTV